MCYKTCSNFLSNVSCDRPRSTFDPVTSYINSAHTSISIYSQHTPCQQTFMPLTLFLSCRMQEAGVCCVFRKKHRKWLHAVLWKEDVEAFRQQRLMKGRTSYAPCKEDHRLLLNFTRFLFRISSQHTLVYYYYCYYSNSAQMCCSEPQCSYGNCRANRRGVTTCLMRNLPSCFYGVPMWRHLSPSWSPEGSFPAHSHSRVN